MRTLQIPKDQNFTLLLCCLFLLFTVAPFFVGHWFAEEIFIGIFSMVLVASIYLVNGKKPYFFLSFWLGILVLISNLVGYMTISPLFDLCSISVNALFFGSVIYALTRAIFGNSRITMNLIMGAICIYLLLGMEWGLLYTLLDFVLPGSFSVTPAVSSPPLELLLQNYFYYSFTTLTTLGIGDITPISAPARFFSILEAITGQIYLTVLVGRLVGMHISKN